LQQEPQRLQAPYLLPEIGNIDVKVLFIFLNTVFFYSE